MAAAEILIVDDEADIRDLVAGILQDEGYSTRTARNSDEALAAIVTRRPSLALLDIWLQGSTLDGLQLLDAVKQEHVDLPVVMISGHGNIETAVAAIKQGAYDFIEKPFKADRLLLVVERAIEHLRLRREVKQLRQMAPASPMLVGKSAAMSQLRQTIEKVARTNSRILLVGPSGSGKELTARAIHQMSNFSTGPFVVLNAAAITPDRMEVELFGQDKTNGSDTRKAGALEEAHGGTLFIDDVAELPRETQNKILRVLVDQNFQRVGGSSKITVDVRIISRRRVTWKRRLPPENSAKTCITGCRSSRSGSRRWQSGGKTLPCWWNISWIKFPRAPACRGGGSAKTPWPCFSRTTGPETSGNCATISNG